MKKYVQILKGKANPIVIEDDKVEELRTAGVKIIDVTNITPQPQSGWIYNSDDGTFSEPIIEPVTNITNIDFWNRFTETEQESLVESTSKKIKRFLYALRIRLKFDLTDIKLINVINALEEAGIIGIDRADEILKV